MTTDMTDDAAMRELLDAFPDVPMQIIVDVLAGYLQLTGSLTEAVRAAHVRIADACAVG
jgi:hypothetical protein